MSDNELVADPPPPTGAAGLRIATLNLGPGGLTKCQANLQTWMVVHSINVMHLQEVRNVEAETGKKGRRLEWKDIMKNFPEYSLIHNGRIKADRQGRIAATKVDSSLTRWLNVLPINTQRGPAPPCLRSRVVAARLHIPGNDAVTVANVWMPDSSKSRSAQKEAFLHLKDMVGEWRGQCEHVHIARDFNTTAIFTDATPAAEAIARLGDRPTLQATDSELNMWCKEHPLDVELTKDHWPQERPKGQWTCQAVSTDTPVGHFANSFKHDQSELALTSTYFSLLNLFARMLTCITSDVANRYWGVCGRLINDFLCSLLMGVFLLVFSVMTYEINGYGSVISALCAWALFLAITEGVTNGVVPFIEPTARPTFHCIGWLLLWLALLIPLIWIPGMGSMFHMFHSDSGSAAKHAMLFAGSWGLFLLTIALDAFITVRATSNSASDRSGNDGNNDAEHDDSAAMPTACYIATQGPHTPVTPLDDNCMCPKYAHEHLSSAESTLAGHYDYEGQQQQVEDCAEEDNIAIDATSNSGGDPRQDTVTSADSEGNKHDKPLTPPRPHTSRHAAPHYVALEISMLVLFAILHNASAEPIAMLKDFDSRGVGLWATSASSAITTTLDFIVFRDPNHSPVNDTNLCNAFNYDSDDAYPHERAFLGRFSLNNFVYLTDNTANESIVFIDSSAKRSIFCDVDMLCSLRSCSLQAVNCISGKCETTIMGD